MFKRDESSGLGGDTVIAAGVKVEGDFTATGSVVIEGEVSGSVTVTGDLRVGQAAKISASVSAKNASVAGEIRGNLQVAEMLDLGASSRITGDVEAKVLVVAAGAYINGNLTMGSSVGSGRTGKEHVTEEKS